MEEAKFIELQLQLLRRFGGVTSTQRQFPLQGLWKSKTGELFQDDIVVFTVLDFHAKTDFEIIRHLEQMKTRLKKKFAQLDILITVQHLTAI